MAGKTKWAAALLAALALSLFTACGAVPERKAGEPTPTPDTGRFTVDILSTGKSDCALIRMDELVILSDAADEDDLEDICALLDSYGIQEIDFLVLSHYDKDHIGAAPGLLRRYRVGTVYGPNYSENSEEYRALFAACRDTGTAWTRPMGDLLFTTDNGTLRLDPADENYGDDNNNSLLMTLTYRDARLLFLGDAEKKRMEEMEEAAAGESCDFIKLPHHGDSSKPLLRLVESAAPAWAVETVSPFEIVDQKLLQTLERTGTELFLTRDGPVHLAWDGGGLTASQDKAP